ncbi:MAG: glycosyltransferase family 2 protein [Burkholderiaceae bacterium]
MLTILTPTYNRRHTLPRLYQSLQDQSSKEFEWLLVDDGSTDETKQWFDALDGNRSFVARLIKQENGGKHVAVNTGVAQAKAGWVFIVDSDDALTPDAVEIVVAALADRSTQGNVAGVCFRKCDFEGRLVGQAYSGVATPFVSQPTRVGRMVAGDLAYVFRRDIMASMPFPVIDGEKFVPELYIWNKISDQGDIWFYLDKVIYRCDYLPDGYTRNFNEHLKRHPRGFFLFYSSQIARESDLLGKAKAAIRAIQCGIYIVRKSLLKKWA